MSLSRRAFGLGAAAMLAALAAPLAPALGRSADLLGERLRALGIDPGLARALSDRCQGLSTGQAAATVRHACAAPLHDGRSAEEWLKEAVAEDFRHGRTVIVDGWVISRTEHTLFRGLPEVLGG